MIDHPQYGDMASASPTNDRSARESQDRSGEAFESFDGGMKTLADIPRYPATGPSIDRAPGPRLLPP
jgi:hypothetical protein